jgi:CDP-diacylglycerol--glycerol-3-phosphate 3-phosphatidyltransferase
LIKHIPNLLTLLRLLLVPVIVYTYYNQPAGSWLCFTFFFIAGFSDYVDGLVARRYSIVSEFGKLADPIADKLVIGTALVLLAIDDVVPTWIAVVILTREILVTLARFWVLDQGVLPADRGGKAKTMLQGFSLLFFLMPVSISPIPEIMLYLATALTITTGIRYLEIIWKMKRQSA